MKPGIKTTEFWLSTASAVVGALMASGLFADGSTTMRILGVVAMVLATMGYQWSRGMAKGGGTIAKIVILLLCLGLGAAAQTVTVHTDSGRYEAIWGQGGTVAAPHPIGGGFRTIDLPDRQGILLASDGQVRPFRRITTDRLVVYTAGSRPLVGEFGVDYIPDDPATYRRGTSHEIMPFEVIPVLFPHDAHLPPSQAKVDAIRRELREVTNLDRISQWPRAVRLLQAFDDRGLPRRTPFGQTDLAWLLRNWDYTAGGRPMVGWYNGVCVRGSGGFDNWHYNQLLWLATHYVAAPRDDLYRFGLQQAIAHACYGRAWFGPDAGFARYEKGGSFIGENYATNSWAKQWSAGLIVWHRMTDDPILGMQVDLMREQLRQSNPDTIWQGYWGARTGSHYLDELLVHWLNHREDWIVAKAKRYLANCKAWQNPDGTWPNLGNRGAAEESPWMQAQLVTAIFRWLEHRPDLEVAFSKAEAVRAGAAVWTKGSQVVAGHRMLKYRFLTTEVPPSNVHLTGFAVPMLRYMAGEDEETWGPVYRETEALVYEWAGSSLTDIANGTPVPISELGIRLPSQGLGWKKALCEALEGLR